MKNLRTLLTTIAVLLFSVTLLQSCRGNNVGNDKNSESAKIDNTIINGHEAVDLGLSVKWATCNVGADVPEEYGDYYAWGEVVSKSNYNWNSYKWCKNGDTDCLMTKYCEDDNEGIVDGLSCLQSVDDVAAVKWGDGWRMPTEDEFKELINECRWQWTIINGINGQLATGPNGNNIFLPATGVMLESNIEDLGIYGGYWSSNIGHIISRHAKLLGLRDGDPAVMLQPNPRFAGLSIRPVTNYDM